MQHWHIYRKWNKKLFEELYLAFQNGRMAKDPAEFWYQGELGFFDNYIIPLAKKLKDCNVFGVSSDECLNYALENRAEWQERGQEIVREMHLEVLGRTPPAINDYQTQPIEDQRYDIGAELDYKMNRFLSLGARYLYTYNDVDAVGVSDWDRHLVGVYAKARF